MFPPALLPEGLPEWQGESPYWICHYKTSQDRAGGLQVREKNNSGSQRIFENFNICALSFLSDRRQSSGYAFNSNYFSENILFKRCFSLKKSGHCWVLHRGPQHEHRGRTGKITYYFPLKKYSLFFNSCEFPCRTTASVGSESRWRGWPARRSGSASAWRNSSK